MTRIATDSSIAPIAVGKIKWTEHTRNHYSARLGGLSGLHIEAVRSPRWRSFNVKPWRIAIGGNSFGHDERFDDADEAMHAAECAALKLIRQLAKAAGLTRESA